MNIMQNNITNDPNPFVLERVFSSSIQDVWRAITEPALMKQWYFDIPSFTAEKGFCFQFTGGPSPDKQYVHLCEITEVVPFQKLSHSWRYEGYPGNSFLTFELLEEGACTRLRLTHSGLETFPSDNPDFAKENFVAGWNHIINESLRTFFER